MRPYEILEKSRIVPIGFERKKNWDKIIFCVEFVCLMSETINGSNFI